MFGEFDYYWEFDNGVNAHYHLEIDLTEKIDDVRDIIIDYADSIKNDEMATIAYESNDDKEIEKLVDWVWTQKRLLQRIKDFYENDALEMYYQDC